MQKLRYPVNFIGITTYYSSEHQGLDLGWHDTPNEPIYACADGKVTNIWQDEQFGGGLSLHIDYDNGFGSDFKHLSSTIVNVGDRVSQAQQVAVMGNSGWASAGYHLHYNCYKNGARVNPIDYTYVYKGQEVSNSCKDKVLYYDSSDEEIKKLEEEIEELNNRIALQEKQIQELEDYITNYKCEFNIEEDNYYKIKMYKDEILLIKFANDTNFEMQLSKGDIVKIK